MEVDEQPHLEKVVFRGTLLLLMAVMLPVFGVLCIGLAVDSFRTADGFEERLLTLGWGVGAPMFLWLGVRSALGGIRADGEGVQITNVWSKHRLQWDDVKDVVVHQTSDEGVGAYVLHFQLAEGYIASTFPEVWFSSEPLERARLALLRLRADALERRVD